MRASGLKAEMYSRVRFSRLSVHAMRELIEALYMFIVDVDVGAVLAKTTEGQ